MPIEALFTGQPPLLRFVYRDAKSTTTQREATPLSVVIMKDGSEGMRALCALRGAKRTFAFSRLVALLALDGTPSPRWSDVHTAVQGPVERLRAAQRFAGAMASWPASHPSWARILGAETGMAWRDVAGVVRLDPKMEWHPEEDSASAHAWLARKRAMNQAATALLNACPKEASMAMVHEGRAAWSGPDHPGWQRLA